MGNKKFYGANYRLPQPGIDFMPTTRCKFVCSEEIKRSGSKAFKFHPVINGSDENKDFYKYTPSGVLEFSCVNEKVQFEVGKSYYIDISEAE